MPIVQPSMELERRLSPVIVPEGCAAGSSEGARCAVRTGGPDAPRLLTVTHLSHILHSLFCRPFSGRDGGGSARPHGQLPLWYE